MSTCPRPTTNVSQGPQWFPLCNAGSSVLLSAGVSQAHFLVNLLIRPLAVPGGGGFLHERPRLALISGKRAVDASGPTLRLVEPASLFEKQIMFATVNTNIPFGREEAHRYGMENRVHASTWRSTNQLLCHDLSSCLMRQTGNPQNFQGGVIPFKHSLRRISESLL